MSRHRPQFEKKALVSLRSVAPTVMAFGALAGDMVHASLLALPKKEETGSIDSPW